VLHYQEGAAAGWKASLDLTFFPSGERTGFSCRHFGPLRVQKPFYPEGGTCHVYLLHPPGGVVGGDELAIHAEARAGASALATTPAAGKFYRSAGPLATQDQLLRVAAGGALEWLPQESIVYPGANALSRTRVELEAGAAFLGWEIVSFGLPASGAFYDHGDHGEFTQRFEIVRDGEPVLLERGRYEGGSKLMAGAFGLGGRTVMGTLFATLDDAAPLPQARESLCPAAGEDFSMTFVDGIAVCRFFGSDAWSCKALLARAWEALRPHALGRPACPPRIWKT